MAVWYSRKVSGMPIVKSLMACTPGDLVQTNLYINQMAAVDAPGQMHRKKSPHTTVGLQWIMSTYSNIILNQKHFNGNSISTK